MSCSNPNIAINFGVNPETGKNRIKFVRPHVGESFRDYQKRYGADNVLLLPCGHCYSCLLEKRKEWAIRCALESLSYKDNCFVTLTYDQGHCPKKLIKRDLQDFIKSIRNLGYKCRYFASGEYGSLSARPHYHLCLFGYCPKDMKLIGHSKSNEAIYQSFELDNCWKKGIVTVQYFSSACGGYVAGYVGKKIGEDNGFILMSKRPGIGYKYFEENMNEIYKFDNIVENLGSYKVVSPSRYYDKLAEKFGIDIQSVKAQRIAFGKAITNQKMRDNKFEHIESLFQFDRLNAQHKMNLLKRGL